MSEAKSFMQQLDDWTDAHVAIPLIDNGPEAVEQVKKAIREKVLESYRNGQKAGPTKPTRKEPRR